MAGNSSKLDYLRARLMEAERATTLSGKQIAIIALREAISEIERLSAHIIDHQLWSETYGRSGNGVAPHF